MRVKFQKVVILGFWLMVSCCFANYFYFATKKQAKKIQNPRNELVFLKTFKCGTETITHVIRRYGVRHNLTFVTPVSGRNNLSWPYKPGNYSFRPALQDGGFHLLTEHMRYDRDFIDRIMRPNPILVTCIREPFSHFKSVFNYFEMYRLFERNSSTKPFDQFFTNMSHFDQVYMSSNSRTWRVCVPDNISVSKNFLSHSLGWNPTVDASVTNIKSFISAIEREFHLVMILEYFVESLIIFRRIMNWTFRDLIHVSLNMGSYNFTFTDNTTLRHLFAAWSPVDHALYNHFYDLLQRRIKLEGEDFFHEVAAFRNTQHQVNQFCSLKEQTKIFINPSRWNDAFIFTTKDCQQLYVDTRLLVYSEYEKKFKYLLSRGVAIPSQPPFPSKKIHDSTC